MNNANQSMLPVEPRQGCMADHQTVMAMVESMKAQDGWTVDYDSEKETVIATANGAVVYSGIRKGARDFWIISYSINHFHADDDDQDYFEGCEICLGDDCDGDSCS